MPARTSSFTSNMYRLNLSEVLPRLQVSAEDLPKNPVIALPESCLNPNSLDRVDKGLIIKLPYCRGTFPALPGVRPLPSTC